MNTYKSLISFLFVLAVVNRGDAAFTALTEKSICVKGSLVQYTNNYSCECDKDLVHKTELECTTKITECKNAKEVCGDFAECKTTPLRDGSFTCQCIDGYEPNGASPSVCVPKGCKAMADTCKANGFCSKKDDATSICACHLGFKLDSGSNACVADTGEVPPCKLECKGENAACEKVNPGFYKCGCAAGFELKEGKCVKIEEVYKPLDNNTKCTGGRLVQFANYYGCLCDDKKMHSDETTCVDAVAADKCTKEKEACGEFASCVKVASKEEYTCECNEGYEYIDDKKTLCAPKGCKAKKDTCETNACIKADKDKVMCGCPLGKKLDAASGKCVPEADNPKCDLKCSDESEECVLGGTEFYACQCKPGFELKEGKCVKAAPVIPFVPLDATTKCTDGKLVQFFNYFACKCADGKVHSDDTTCVTSTKGKCTKEKDVCGDYATCVKDTESGEIKCLCNAGYEPSLDKVPVCKPIGCNDIKDICEKNECIRDDNTTVKCGCPLGKKIDPSTGKCIANSTNPKCELKCTLENEECKIENSIFYQCNCKDNFEYKDNKCQAKGDSGSAFPAYGIFNVGLLFLVSSIMYVLV